MKMQGAGMLCSLWQKSVEAHEQIFCLTHVQERERWAWGMCDMQDGAVKEEGTAVTQTWALASTAGARFVATRVQFCEFGCLGDRQE